MSALNHFRTFEISQDGGGDAFELSRCDERVVCLAFDARFGCFCEIAALTEFAEDAHGAMEEFLEQAGTVAGLHHRGLASLLDYGDDQGVGFYAVEFVDGETVSDYAGRVVGLPPALAFGLCADLAEALCAISVLGLPITAGDARVTLDDRGRLRARIVDYPLGLTRAAGSNDPAAAVFELAHLLDQLAAGEVIGRKGRPEVDVGEVAGQLRQLGSVHDAAVALRDAAGGGHFITVESRHRPRLMLAQKLFSHGAPEEFLSDDYRVEQVSPAAADPYSISVLRLSESLPLRMHVLPPAYILSDENLPIYETERVSAVVGAEALWRSEHFRLVSERRFPGFSLSALLRQAGELSDLEVMLLLDGIETAILEDRSAGAELAKIHPDNVLLHFAGWDFDEAEALMKRRPITGWPEFSVVLRAYQTMRGLTTLTPNAKGRFVQMRAALTNQEPVNNLALLEVYLQLHDSGRAEQAEELLDRFEQSCRASVAAAAAAAADEELDTDDEVVSPIALQVAEGKSVPVGDDEDDDDDSLLSPLGGGVLFGRERFDDDWLPEDGGDVDAGAEDELVVSPIAAAMGIDVSDAGDGRTAGPQFAAFDEALAEDEAEVGFGGGLLGIGVPAGGAEAGIDLEESPFGPGMALEDADDDDDEGGLLPRFDYDTEFDMDNGGGGRGLGFFVMLAVLAIALAAVIAHLTGRAFWLR